MPKAVPGVLRESQLREMARRHGVTVRDRRPEELEEVLSDLSSDQRALVVRSLGFGEPVTVTRPSRRGEPPGGVEMSFRLVQMEGR